MKTYFIAGGSDSAVSPGGAAHPASTGAAYAMEHPHVVLPCVGHVRRACCRPRAALWGAGTLRVASPSLCEPVRGGVPLAAASQSPISQLSCIISHVTWFRLSNRRIMDDVGPVRGIRLAALGCSCFAPWLCQSPALMCDSLDLCAAGMVASLWHHNRSSSASSAAIGDDYPGTGTCACCAIVVVLLLFNCPYG